MSDQLQKLFPQLEDIHKDHLIPLPFTQKDYLVNGRIHSWEGPLQEVKSPIYFTQNGKQSNTIGYYPLMEQADALEALDAAVKAWDHGKGEWPSKSIEQRLQHMYHFVELMKEVRTEVVNMLMWEIGKTATDAAKEFDRTVDYILDTIEALKNQDRDASRLILKQGLIAQVRRSPLGVVLCMGPFNYPLNETFTTLIPALIMGNTVLFKPPKFGVLLHAPLLKAFQKAFPKGVVNTVYGDGQKVIAPLMESGEINVLAFIGSSRVADILKKQHPQPHRLKSVLGLEAKNPAIILPDADIEATVKECVTGSLSYNGQRCTALKILFVHEDILDDFQKRFAEAVDQLKPGMPWDAQTQITPLPEENKADYLNALVKDAVDKGANVLNSKGGQHAASFYAPTVVGGVTSDMRLYHEEQFGPVVPIVSYAHIQEPMDYVVNSNYGQQASIFGQDPDLIAPLMDILVNQVCRVNINAQCQRGPDEFPFTGRKDSAEGTLSVSDALRVFSIRTLVAAKETDTNKHIVKDIVRKQKSTFLSTDYII